jgi:hypothetical protein
LPSTGSCRNLFVQSVGSSVLRDLVVPVEQHLCEREEEHNLMFNACCVDCYNRVSLLPQELIFQARYCDGEVDDGDFDADLRQVVRIRHFTCHVKPVTKCQVNPREY